MADKQKWTIEQQNAMKLKGRRLLVSAAAGSGKTAVLTERIIRRITDIENPVDADELLVMTFTKAAASEMRERILKEMEDRLETSEPGTPEYDRLARQTALIDAAKITTIDSFCLSVLRDHTDSLEADPAFRVGGEEELGLLKADVLEKMMEACFEKADPEFVRFVDSYAHGKTDEGVGKLILSVYNFAESMPWPEEWYDAERNETEPETIRSTPVDEFPWVRYLIGEMKKFAGETMKKLDAAILLCREENGPSGYLKTLSSEREKLETMERAETYGDLKNALLSFDWPNIGRNPKNTDPETAGLVKAVRDSYKKQIRDELIVRFVFPEELIRSDLSNASAAVRMLIDLAESFGEQYAAKKRERNLVDFNDLEHMALTLLWDRNPDGSRVKSAIAREYETEFREIYVDEYQDSNRVQEQLIKALEHGEVFMVGDVKQSIYSFRQASPELFSEKYETYEKYDGEEAEETEKPVPANVGTRINLTKNFRSRTEVIDTVNKVFRRLMDKSLGNVDYDEDAELKYGAGYAPYGEEPGTVPAGKTELLLADTADADEDADNRETEARLVAAEIKRLTDPVSGISVWDRKTKSYRRAGYSDIVILLRTQKGWAETFVNTLTGEGIPAYAETNTGYFDTVEVKTVLSILSAADNPLQDIPLAAFLCSPVIGMTEKEIAGIVSGWNRDHRESGKEIRLYRKLREAFEAGETSALHEKIGRALGMLKDFSGKAVFMKLKELIRYLYDETGYYDYVSALPGGPVRRANLDMLLKKAADFEMTGYSGLYDFNRYIENLKKYETDFGEASVSGENDNTVCIMSIHRSKGLEFPVCIVSGLRKKFNLQDTAQMIVSDPVLGTGADTADPVLHIKGNTLKKNIISWRRKSETLGEELRVLYVAMTRAREKLILTGCMENPAERIRSLAEKRDMPDGRIAMTDIRSAGNYLDWIFMAVSGSPDFCGIDMRTVAAADLALSAAQETGRAERIRKETEEILREKAEPVYIDTDYPYEADVGLHTKLSVSELKRMGQNADEEMTAFPDFVRDTADAGVSSASAGTLSNGSAEAAAGRGTVYHRVMEKLDYAAVTDRDSFSAFLQKLKEQGQLSEEEYDCIDRKDFDAWFSSPLMRRMAEAFRKGKLKRESQFVMTLPADEIYPGIGSKEPVLIQGIMDAWFEEEDGIVLVDYKTDHVSEAAELKKRYAVQLDYYAKALTMMKHKNVRERILWSFALGEAIFL